MKSNSIKARLKKTDVVHVVVMKPFYFPNNKDVAQDVSPTALTPRPEPKRKPGRPRKVVRFQDAQGPTINPTMDNIETIVPNGSNADRKTDSPRPTLPGIRNLPPIRRHAPARLGIIQALSLFLFFGLVMTEAPITDNVYFGQGPSIIFSDSEWIITTEITFSSVLLNSVSGLVNECGYRPPELKLRCDWSPRRFGAFRWVAGARLVSQKCLLC